MPTLPKEVLRNMINDGSLTTAGNLHSYLKDMFKDVLLEVSRDRNGKFEPVVIPKSKRDISGIEQKIIALYGYNTLQGKRRWTNKIALAKIKSRYLISIFIQINISCQIRAN